MITDRIGLTTQSCYHYLNRQFMWKEQAVEKATGSLYGIEKKHVALYVDLLSYPEKKNSVEPVLLAMCHCISSFPHEVVTVKKKKRRQNQDLLENSCQQANAQS